MCLSAYKRDSVERCYYHDDERCDGELWECLTCGEEFCAHHWHRTSEGECVECVACEREREESVSS